MPYPQLSNQDLKTLMIPRKSQFNPGDLVHLRTGHAPQVVLEVKSAPLHEAATGFMIRCSYTRWFSEADKCSKTWRTEADYLLYRHNPLLHDYDGKCPMGPTGNFNHEFAMSEQHKEDSLMGQKLYQTLEEKPRFGTFLTRNSVGKIVLEMKGTNDVQAFDASELEEVKPYTVSVQFVGAKATTFEAAKGLVKEGDVLLFEDHSMAVVTGVNTGYTGPTQQFPENARRIMTEKLGGEATTVPATA